LPTNIRLVWRWKKVKEYVSKYSCKMLYGTGPQKLSKTIIYYEQQLATVTSFSPVVNSRLSKEAAARFY
jgi:hypothetical protein